MSKKSERDSRAERAAAAIAEQQRKERQRQGLVVGGIVVVLLVIVVGLFLTLNANDTSGDEAENVPAGVDDYSVVVGDADAPLEVVIYEDFQCPVCAQFEGAVGEDLAAAVEDGRAKVEYRMVSFLDDASLNEYSSRALNAAMVVLDTAGEDAFVEFHKLLMENQPAEGTEGHTDDELIDYAVQAGATESEVRPGVEDKVFEQWGVNATDEMSKNDVTGTPTVFIDGEVTESPADAVTKLQEALAE